MITSPTNRVYIGSSINILHRWANYKALGCKNQIKLHRSFIKYGVDNHIFEIIWKGDVNEMLEKEAILGNFYDVLEKGLNCKLPKIDDKYQAFSSETLENFRNGQLGRKHPQEVKDKISKSHLNKQFSEEHLENMRISAKTKIFTLEHKKKIAIALRNNRKKIINLTTNIVYDNVEDVCDKLNLTSTNVYTIIKRQKRNKNRKSKYKFEYIDTK